MLLISHQLTAARHRLITLRRPDGGWGYHPGSPSAVEPAALVALALLATATASQDDGVDRAEAEVAARWIAERCRRPDGSTTVSARSGGDAPGWTTPFALLLWNSLAGFEVERRAAVTWLLAMNGKPGTPVPNNPMGHDVTLIGWPWVADTHSWVEPTAVSLLALAPSEPPDQPRMRAGVRVLLDRAIPTGGWNLGNPLVFGQPTRPLPGPTGLALLALARVARPISVPLVIDQAVDYLRKVVMQTTAPVSLGWAALGLRAWTGPLDSQITGRLLVALDRVLARDPSAVELAMLLLACGDDSLSLLGITPHLEPEPAR